MREVVELARADLGQPDVGGAVPVRKERDEAPIARNGRRVLGALEVGEVGESSVGQRVALASVRSTHEPHGRTEPGQDPAGEGQPGEPAAGRRDGRGCGDDGRVPLERRLAAVAAHGTGTPASRPRVELRPRRIDGAQLVVEMPVDRHPLALLPTLDRTDVALEVRGDVLPRIEPVVGRLPWGRYCGIWFGRIGHVGLRSWAGRGAAFAAGILMPAVNLRQCGCCVRIPNERSMSEPGRRPRIREILEIRRMRRPVEG